MRARLMVPTLILFHLSSPWTRAQSKPVPPSELHEAVRAVAAVRQKNLDQVRSFFASPSARSALNAAKLDYRKVETAIMALTSEELAGLASRTVQIEHDFAAGALSNQELTYIVIALAAAVVVLIAVAA